jgi:tRNA U34 5-methylaminomethyl-2-thiouridine-forming methyltransferase MnmC
LHDINNSNFIHDKSSRPGIIYFDAFAPAAQPDLWTKEVFEVLYAILKDNGILVTYCSKGVVRRAMQAAGFAVEKVPGPVGKREIVRAIKKTYGSSTLSII